MKTAFENMSLLDALALARMESGKTQDEIAAEMGWSTSNSNRIFSSENYWPTLPNLPRLCVVLGNTILLEWALIQVESGGVEKAFADMDWLELLEALNKFSAEVGEVHREAAAAVEDRLIDAGESRRLRRKIRKVISRGVSMMNGLAGVK